MVYCAVVGCKSRTYTKAEKEKAKLDNENLSNFRFLKIPKVRVHECDKTRQLSQRRQREWIARLNRKGVADNPQKYKVCCGHILSGYPSNSFDDCSPDWGPSKHLGYDAKSTNDERYSRRKARSQRQLP
ncbi:hypothetical protein HPB52_019878 [Rhipicephalus sanguineus]|uniref:THAP-type domain-containing protein n=1 Tax=Rhipicephalus sanguineus TaxID=34632 RepID=A0A9D4SWP2_RHISA|nr:hypothetical protein HPB52_019878 [Rhipicephalus sanguineus]